MPRFALSLAVTAAALVPSALALVISPAHEWGDNPRSGEEYSTLDTRAALVTVGAEFHISPKDSFDFVPSAGYNKVVDEVEKAVAENLNGNEQIALVRSSDSLDLVNWGTRIGLNASDKIQVVPKPNEALAGKVLTVDSAKGLFKAEGICHMIEEGTYVCHKPNGVDVTEITVSPNGKPSNLWVACHNAEDVARICHVMNVADVVFPHGAGNRDPLLESTAEKFLRGKE
eukprot:CAMPEP_0197452004 /NCGR_PEP_ID=MMETSP1175-20131217/30837_1 /TAXON_ID=1003142 /ORGANISM="Triceratium dubium, Strain CCMP147" /LENGTH=228 /DNA_ID=CAMNT_0042984891 /DNA_START=76 /DNA_END=762 /DNA_ORIENTATION=+